MCAQINLVGPRSRPVDVSSMTPRSHARPTWPPTLVSHWPRCDWLGDLGNSPETAKAPKGLRLPFTPPPKRSLIVPTMNTCDRGSVGV